MPIDKTFAEKVESELVSLSTDGSDGAGGVIAACALALIRQLEAECKQLTAEITRAECEALRDRAPRPSRLEIAALVMAGFQARPEGCIPEKPEVTALEWADALIAAERESG